MADTTEQLNELLREWRESVLDKLTKLDQGQEKIKDEIANIRTTFAYAHEVTALRKEIDDLKGFKSKLIGITIAVQALIAFIILYLKHSS